MHRFYLPPNECKSGPLILRGAEAHHASHVLRLRRGEPVAVLNGVGGEFLCEVRECHRDMVELHTQEKREIAPLPYKITLLQAVPKGKIIEAIIQKATELGVSRIVPLLSERVATRLDDDDAESKAEKWQHVAIEAIKQCGSAWLPIVEKPATPAEFLARGEHFDLPLIASLQPGSRHPRGYFDAFQKERNRAPESVCIWVGPEGDFTRDEVVAAENAGAKPVTLGRLVLRSETAAIYCLSFLNYELQACAGNRFAA
jgi:16S rRNA (uracil1498-N3)-methyltransferase